MNKKKEYISVFLIFILAISVRFYGLQTRGFWWDEIGLWYEALSNETKAQTAPLMGWTFSLVVTLLGSSDFYVLHGVAAIFGSLAVLAAYVLSKDILKSYSRERLMILFAFSPCAIYYSQEARPYGLFMLSTCLIYFGYLRSIYFGGPINFTIFFTGVFLGCLTHLLVVPVIASTCTFHVIYCFLQSKSSKTKILKFLIATALVSAMGLMWVIFREERMTSVLEGTYKKSTFEFIYTAIPNLSYFRTFRGVFDTHEFFFASMNLFFSLAVVVPSFMASEQKSKSSQTYFGVTIAVCAIILYLSLGGKGDWGDWPRYISHLILPFLFLVVHSLEIVQTRMRNKLPVKMAFVLVLVTFLPGISSWKRDAPRDRSARWSTVSKHLSHIQNRLEGVIIQNNVSKYGDEGPRSIHSYYHFKQDDLPVYFMDQKNLFPVIPFRKINKRADVRLFRAQKSKPIDLEVGDYVVLDPNLKFECKALETALQRPVQRRKVEVKNIKNFHICRVTN